MIQDFKQLFNKHYINILCYIMYIIIHEKEMSATPVTETKDPISDLVVILSPFVLLMIKAKSGVVARSVWDISGRVYTSESCYSHMQRIVLERMLRIK